MRKLEVEMLVYWVKGAAPTSWFAVFVGVVEPLYGIIILYHYTVSLYCLIRAYTVPLYCIVILYQLSWNIFAARYAIPTLSTKAAIRQ